MPRIFSHSASFLSARRPPEAVDAALRRYAAVQRWLSPPRSARFSLCCAAARQHVQTRLQPRARGHSISGADVTQAAPLRGHLDPRRPNSDACCCLETHGVLSAPPRSSRSLDSGSVAPGCAGLFTSGRCQPAVADLSLVQKPITPVFPG